MDCRPWANNKPHDWSWFRRICKHNGHKTSSLCVLRIYLSITARGTTKSRCMQEIKFSNRMLSEGNKIMQFLSSAYCWLLLIFLSTHNRGPQRHTSTERSDTLADLLSGKKGSKSIIRLISKFNCKASCLQ